MNSIIGTIVEAGRKGDDGICRIVIHTDEGDLRKLIGGVPLFRAALITIEAIEEAPTSRGMVNGTQVCAPHPSSEPYRGE